MTPKGVASLRTGWVQSRGIRRRASAAVHPRTTNDSGMAPTTRARRAAMARRQNTTTDEVLTMKQCDTNPAIFAHSHESGQEQAGSTCASQVTTCGFDRGRLKSLQAAAKLPIFESINQLTSEKAMVWKEVCSGFVCTALAAVGMQAVLLRNCKNSTRVALSRSPGAQVCTIFHTPLGSLPHFFAQMMGVDSTLGGTWSRIFWAQIPPNSPFIPLTRLRKKTTKVRCHGGSPSPSAASHAPGGADVICRSART